MQDRSAILAVDCRTAILEGSTGSAVSSAAAVQHMGLDRLQEPEPSHPDCLGQSRRGCWAVSCRHLMGAVGMLGSVKRRAGRRIQVSRRESCNRRSSVERRARAGWGEAARGGGWLRPILLPGLDGELNMSRF
ncbi:hypothetical protein KC335_g61 [Hortaea werneckii]|nr:hypothetical protein KC335_g61 [Hortaea werneckii]